MKTKPAETEMDAPERLLNSLRAIGYDCKLRVIRRAVAEVDPDSDPGPVDAPITSEDESAINGTLRAYERDDKPDTGPRFEPPRK
jgi:hypothetical protein